MFRAIILPIFRSTRLCVTACGTMHLRWCRPATSWVHYTTSCNTQSSAPEDGQNNCLKHVELTGIINKPLLLHLVCCLYYIYVLRVFTFILYSNVKFDKKILVRVVKLFLLCVDDLIVIMYISTRNKLYFDGAQKLLSNLTLARYKNGRL